MDDRAFMRAITRLRKGDQYLKAEIGQKDNQSDLACAYTCTYNEHVRINVLRNLGILCTKVVFTNCLHESIYQYLESKVLH